MAFESLAKRIDDLPLVICGPILRRCEPNSVTVWVALKDKREVTLKVYSGAESTDPTHLKLRMDGTQNTVELGKYLHVIAVTAKPIEGGKELAPGEVFFYELLFPECEPNPFEDSFCLNAPGIINDENTPISNKTKLYYTNTDYHQLPSFSLPPKKLTKLRIIHGSCRKLHNEGLDAMPAIDDMLITDWPVADERPHMLFLTGDQIYADDISDAIMFLLDDTSTTLLGWSEQLPDINNSDDLLPGKRKKTVRVKGGFTTNDDDEDGHNHLLRLGEYYAAYLFSWSDVLWPTELPSYSDIFSKPGGKAKFEEEKARLNKFRETLPNIRRALANVPTYMIFDDHDVTDDWYMTREWCESVLTKPLGRRVVQNALMSYAIFQAWGNTPKEFALVPGADPKPGKALLDLAKLWSQEEGKGPAIEVKIAERLGLPPREEIFIFNWESVRFVLNRPSGALVWHFAITFCSDFEVIFFDTRTRRSFSDGPKDPPLMLSLKALDDQLPSVKKNPEEEINSKLVTIIVMSTPFIKIPVVHSEGLPWLGRAYLHPEELPWYLVLLKWLLGGKKSIYEFDNLDHWLNQEDLFETLLAKIATRWRVLDKDQSRVVVLTGDVHFAAASRLQYQSNTLYKGNLENPGTYKEYRTVIAQFSSSALKKESNKTRFLHYHGYKFGNWAAISLALSEKLKGDSQDASEWSDPNWRWSESSNKYLPPSSKWFGWGRPLAIGESLKGRPELSYGRSKRMSSRTPALVDANKIGDDWILKPHWRYRIDYILAENEVREPAPITPNELYSPSPGDRKESIKSYLKLAKDHKDYAQKWGNGKEIVGVNNVGELSFDWSETNKSVIQSSWWRLKSKSNNAAFLKAFPLSKFKVSFEFEDSDFKMPKIPSEKLSK